MGNDVAKSLVENGAIIFGGDHGGDDCDDVGNSLVANGAIILKR